MMIVASIVPDFLMGIITGAGIQGVMMLNGGFFRKPDDLPEAFWKYPMYHIGFPKYSNQGYYKNAFIGLTFPNDLGGGIITGEDILKNIWQVELGYSKWVDLAILFGMVLVYRLMFLGIIKFCEKVVPMIKALLAGLAKPNNAQISEITNPPSQTRHQPKKEDQSWSQQKRLHPDRNPLLIETHRQGAAGVRPREKQNSLSLFLFLRRVLGPWL